MAKTKTRSHDAVEYPKNGPDTAASLQAAFEEG